MRPLLRTALPTVAALAVLVLTVSLGNWQLRRADEKLALQAQSEAADRQPPVAIAQQALAEADARGLEGRRVEASGRLLPERSIFIDNRTHKGIAGFHVVTPLRIEGSERNGAQPLHVLVLRGWVPRDPRERTRLPEVPAPEGPVTVTGYAQRELAQTLELAESAPPGPDDRIWQNLRLDAYRQWSGLALQPLLIRQIGPVGGAGPGFDDRLVREWPQPGSDVDKHRGYAFQWYSLAAATAALWFWFVVWRPLKRRGGRPVE